jgi:putative tryptophan/tyrosine transport system substrate-binding protein
MLDVRRREFIALLGGTAAWPLAARAEQQSARPVIGSLYAVSAAQWAEYMAGFRRGLNEMGFVEGRSVAIEYRWADNHLERLPALAADLVGRKVAVILVGASNIGVRAVMSATRTIPIVFTTGADPVAAGFVASLNRPAGNVTGVTLITGELLPKKLELLHEVIPAATKIALLADLNDPVAAQENVQGAQAVVRRFGLEIIVLKCGTESEIESAFATAVQQRAAALYVSAGAFLVSRREQIAALGLRHAIPTSSPQRQDVAAGVLMSYGADYADGYRQAGRYVGRILKGEKPADLPVVQPTKFELVINLKTAKALGLDVPPTLLARMTTLSNRDACCCCA